MSLSKQDALSALGQVLQDARETDRLRAELLEAHRAAYEWEKIAKELGTGVSVEHNPSRRRLELRIVIDEMMLAQLKDRYGYMEYVAHQVFETFKAALKQRGLWP